MNDIEFAGVCPQITLDDDYQMSMTRVPGEAVIDWDQYLIW